MWSEVIRWMSSFAVSCDLLHILQTKHRPIPDLEPCHRQNEFENQTRLKPKCPYKDKECLFHVQKSTTKADSRQMCSYRPINR